jgi:K+-sensing histidine kinase KdpD
MSPLLMKRGQLPVTEVVVLIIVLIAIVVAIVILFLFRSQSTNILQDILNVLSFNWLFGKL